MALRVLEGIRRLRPPPTVPNRRFRHGVRPEETGGPFQALFGAALIGGAGAGIGYLGMQHQEDMEQWKCDAMCQCPDSCNLKNVCPLPEIPAPPASSWTDMPVRPCVCAKETCLNCRCRSPCEWEVLLAEIARAERERKLGFKIKRLYCWAVGMMGGDADKVAARLLLGDVPEAPSLSPPPTAESIGWMQDAWKKLKSTSASMGKFTISDEEEEDSPTLEDRKASRRRTEPEVRPETPEPHRPRKLFGGMGAGEDEPRVYTPSPRQRLAEEPEVRPPTPEPYAPRKPSGGMGAGEDEAEGIRYFPQPKVYAPSSYFDYSYSTPEREESTSTPPPPASPPPQKLVEEKPPATASSPWRYFGSKPSTPPQQQQHEEPPSSPPPGFFEYDPPIPYFKRESQAENAGQQLVDQKPSDAASSSWRYFAPKKPTQPPSAPQRQQPEVTPTPAKASNPRTSYYASSLESPDLKASLAPASKCAPAKKEPQMFEQCPSHPLIPPGLPSRPSCDRANPMPPMPPPPPCMQLPPPPPPPPPPPAPLCTTEKAPPQLPMSPIIDADLPTPPFVPSGKSIGRVGPPPCMPQKVPPASMAKCQVEGEVGDKCGNNISLNSDSGDPGDRANESADGGSYDGRIPAIPALPDLPPAPTPLAPMEPPSFLARNAESPAVGETTPSLRQGLIDVSPDDAENPSDGETLKVRRKRRRRRKISRSGDGEEIDKRSVKEANDGNLDSNNNNSENDDRKGEGTGYGASSCNMDYINNLEATVVINRDATAGEVNSAVGRDPVHNSDQN